MSEDIRKNQNRRSFSNGLTYTEANNTLGSLILKWSDVKTKPVEFNAEQYKELARKVGEEAAEYAWGKRLQDEAEKKCGKHLAAGTSNKDMYCAKQFLSRIESELPVGLWTMFGKRWRREDADELKALLGQKTAEQKKAEAEKKLKSHELTGLPMVEPKFSQTAAWKQARAELERLAKERESSKIALNRLVGVRKGEDGEHYAVMRAKDLFCDAASEGGWLFYVARPRGIRKQQWRLESPRKEIWDVIEGDAEFINALGIKNNGAEEIRPYRDRAAEKKPLKEDAAIQFWAHMLDESML